MTEKQNKFLPGKEDKEIPCFILATMMRQLFNVIERSFLALYNAIKEIKFNPLGQRNSEK